MLPLSHTVFLRTWGGWEIRMRQESFWVVPHSPASWSSDKVGAEAKRLVRHFVFLYVTSTRPDCLSERSSHTLFVVRLNVPDLICWYFRGLFSMNLCSQTGDMWENISPLSARTQIKLHLIVWLWTGVDSSKICQIWLTWVCRITRIFALIISLW